MQLNFYSTTRELLASTFSIEELDSLCQDLDILIGNVGGKELREKAGNLVDYCRRHGKIEELLTRCRELRPHVKWPSILQETQAKTSDSDSQESYSTLGQTIEIGRATRVKHTDQAGEAFPFTNRVDELEALKSSFMPRFVLIDAPAGFGKSQLLFELARHLDELNWVAIYVPVDQWCTLSDLSSMIAEALRIEDLLQSVPARISSPGFRLGSALQRYWQSESRSREGAQGLILLFDFEKETARDICSDVTEALVPQIETSLRNLASLGGRFRVICAGHNLAQHSAGSNYFKRVHSLSPFTYDVVEDSIGRYVKDYDSSSIRRLAAHLFFLTGGHPGCFAKGVHLATRAALDPDVFLSHFYDQLWDIIKQYVSQIDTYLGENAEVMERLSVHRFSDYVLLQETADSLGLSVDPYDLGDQLTGAHLLRTEGRFLKDDIIRRMLATRMRNEQPDDYAEFTQQAQQFCLSRVSSTGVQNPERWLVEFLFQVVQSILIAPMSSEPPSQNMESFLDHDLRSGLEAFLKERQIDPREWRAERAALLEIIQDDWELRFMINYAFRRQDFTNEPFQTFLERISDHFDTSC